MSIVFPDSRASAPLSRRGVLLGLAASSLPAPAIVRISSIMPVRRVLLTDTSRSSAGFAQRLFCNSLAVGLRRGLTTFRFSASALTLSEAESIVRYARRNGWIDERYVAYMTSGSRSSSGEDQSKQ